MNQAVKTAILAVALVGLAGTGWKIPVRADATYPVSLALSPIVMDFDEGLDVRDELGRPVKSFVAHQQLKQLFVSGVLALLTRPELPELAAFLAALDKTWNFFVFAFTRPIAQAWRSFIDLGMPDPRKGQGPPLMVLVSALLSTLILLRFGISDNSSRTQAFLSCLSSTVLRC